MLGLATKKQIDSLKTENRSLQEQIIKIQNEKRDVPVVIMGQEVGNVNPYNLDPSLQLFLNGQRVDTISSTMSTVPASTVDLVYKLVPIYATCVDGISREISNCKLSVVPYDSRSRGNLRDKKRIEELFRIPNVNNQGFPSFLYELSHDILDYGKNVIEKCYARDYPELLMELWTRPSDTFTEKRDDNGVITGYIQKIDNKDPIPFDSNKIVMMQYNSRSKNHQGRPMLEGILGACDVIIFAMDFILRTFNYDEVPSGVLWLKGANADQINQIKAEIKAKREGGLIKHFLSMIGGDFDVVQWIDMKASIKDLEMLRHVEAAERRIVNRFGLTSVDVNDIQNINKGTGAIMAELKNSKLIKPLAKLFEYAINSEIVWSDISMDWRVKLIPQAELSRTQVIEESKILIPLGAKTINQTNEELNQPIVDGGDEPVIITGGGRIVRVKDLPTGNLNPQLASFYNPSGNNEPQKTDKEQGMANSMKSVLNGKKEEILNNLCDNDLSTLEGKISDSFKSIKDLIGKQTKNLLADSFIEGLRKKDVDGDYKSFQHFEEKIKEFDLGIENFIDSSGFKDSIEKAVTFAKNTKFVTKEQLLAVLSSKYDKFADGLCSFAIYPYIFEHYGVKYALDCK